MFIANQIDLWDLDDAYLYEVVKDDPELFLAGTQQQQARDLIFTYIGH